VWQQTNKVSPFWQLSAEPTGHQPHFSERLSTTQDDTITAEVTGSFQKTAARKTARAHCKKHRDGSVGLVIANHRGGSVGSVIANHRGGSVGLVVANHRSGGESSVTVTTLTLIHDKIKHDRQPTWSAISFSITSPIHSPFSTPKPQHTHRHIMPTEHRLEHTLPYKALRMCADTTTVTKISGPNLQNILGKI